MNVKLKSWLPYLGCILLFAVISMAYFTPSILEGKVLFQGDTQQGIAVNHESNLFLEETGEITRWTNSLFSGMPTYQNTPVYGINPFLSAVLKFYRLYLPSPASYLFIMLLGFFILLQTLRVRKDLSVLGAIMFTFSSYFLIIIEAGHIWKFFTLAYIPPTIAGIILAYRGRYLAGAALAGFFAMLQIKSNHVQMTYYFLFVIAALVIAFLIDHARRKELAQFFKASTTLAVAALLAVGVNIASLYHTYEYGKQTMRGGSELIQDQSSTAQINKKGLNLDYITQWSYGKAETLTLLIPNFVGGASGVLGNNETAKKNVIAQHQPYLNQFNQYWGDQPFTSGPVYVGAFVLFLAILAIFLAPSPLTWALLASTLLSLFLAWGKNFMALTSFMVEYFPLYDKFRAVSSILVIAEFTIPVLAILALKKIIEEPTIIKEKINGVYVSLALTAGVALVAFLLPSVFSSFLSEQETLSILPQVQKQPQLKAVVDSIIEARTSIFKADALRSLLIILAGTTALIVFVRQKISAGVLVILLTVLTLGDLWSVDKRYLNEENFVSERKLDNPFPQTQADKTILQDKDPHYRVFNLSTNPFNDAVTSYHHKSIGGYHAAKLQRYQDLIDYHLSSKMTPGVINMLNAKYIIQPSASGQPVANLNSGALGNVWFVENLEWVNSPNEEINQLDQINPAQTAVINQRFKAELGNKDHFQVTPEAQIKLTSYKPNELRYQSNNPTEGLALFSEIYYPGWVATIDGIEVPIAQANYVLRALEIPAGTHEIVFSYRPHSIEVTDWISYVCFTLLVALMASAIYYSCKQKCKS